MQAAVLVLLLGLSLVGVHGIDNDQAQPSPDLLSMVRTLQNQVQSLQTEVQSLQNQEQALQVKVQELKNSQIQQQNSPRVGFFAAFYQGTEGGNHGPFNVDTTIKYKQVLTNVGNGYNAITGLFTAPVRGLYVFHFTMFTRVNAVASLRRNGVKLAYAYDKSSADIHDSTTRVAVVTLEVGDTVYVELQKDSYFHGYGGDHNSFSGFLLSPM